VQTDACVLKASDGETQGIKLGTQYVLQTQSKEGLQRIFDVDPSLAEEEEGDDSMQLARYLKERVLTIDVWNADSLMHVGTCKVPLSSFMRQGEPSRIVAQEYDLCEAEFGTYIGGMQLLVSNEGRKVAGKQAPSPPGGHKHKKKVTSKPLEKVENTDSSMPSLATMYDAAKTNHHQSEDARKKLRVERLKRQTVQTELTQTLTVLSNPTASEWDKMSSLRQIEMVRETKKHAILEKVLKESLGSKQTVDVVTG